MANFVALQTNGILLTFVQSAADSDNFTRVNASDFRLRNVGGEILLKLPTLLQYFDKLE